MPSLFALLVGIDNYPPGVPTLKGCVNDANAMRAFLEDRYAHSPMNIVSLLNEQATRSNVIDSFRSHLGKAQPGDVGFFFYAGHGSEQTATAEELALEPDGKDQTQVLFDSRLPGGQDLIDKELSRLISEITARGVHMTVMLDCCHSGSATRDLEMTPRQAPAREAPAAASRLLREPQPSASQPSAPVQGDITPGNHIALEACQSVEVANEYATEAGQHRGAFTYFLLQELHGSAELPSYFDLMQRVRPRVQAQVSQTPQLERVNGDGDLHNVFLGVTRKPPAEGRLATFRLKAWEVNAGAALGISIGDSFALYPPDAPSDALSDPTKAVAIGTVARVLPAACTLEIADASKLDPAVLYTAMMTSRATKINVSFDGDEACQVLLRTAIATSLYVKEGPGARLSVSCADGKFSVSAPLQYGFMPEPLIANEKNAAIVGNALEHMARWIMRLELQGPAATNLAGIAQFSVIECDKPGEPVTDVADFGKLELVYVPDEEGVLQPPNIKVRITNLSAGTLYVTLLAFTSSWSISAGMLPAGYQRLGPGEYVYAFGAAPQTEGTAIPVEVDPPATESHDDLLLIASSAPVNGRDFEQEPLSIFIEGTRGFGAPVAPFRSTFLTRRLHVHTRITAA